VLINKDSRPWIIICLLLLAAASIAYFSVPGMGQRRLDGPSGGTPEGLIFGVAGYAMMLFALLLGARKRVRSLRVGRAYWWCQGHVWFGILSFPIIVLHGGFKAEFWGGTLTWWIMWLFLAVWISGLVGLVLQQIMPNRLLNQVPMETIFEQVDNIIDQLRREAEQIVKSVSEKTQEDADEIEEGSAGTVTAIAPARIGAEAGAKLATFYNSQVKPILQERIPLGSPLARERQATAAFAQLRDTMPVTMRKPVDDLADICEERRQLARQKRLHHILHGWLFVHVPLSYGLMVLSTVHAFQALQYTSSQRWVWWAFASGLAAVLVATMVILAYGMMKKK
jgi:hypothetical protein